MFNVGAGELVFILVAALLVLGPTRLPEFARAIGKFVREFRRQTDEVRTVVEREFYKMDQDVLDEPRPPVPMGRPASLPSPVPAALQAAASEPLPPVSPQDHHPGLSPAAESLAHAAVESPAPQAPESVPVTATGDVSQNS